MKFKELRKKRTGVDFSNYKYERKVLNVLGLKVIIDALKREEGSSFFLFINTPSGLNVVNRCTSYSFDRSFIPHHDAYVNEGYWLDKLSYDYDMFVRKLDMAAIDESIDELRDELDDYGFNEDEMEASLEFIDNLCTDDAIGYLSDLNGYGKPDCLECVDFPTYEYKSDDMDIVFDAFNEICDRLFIKHKEENDLLEERKNKIRELILEGSFYYTTFPGNIFKLFSKEQLIAFKPRWSLFVSIKDDNTITIHDKTSEFEIECNECVDMIRGKISIFK